MKKLLPLLLLFSFSINATAQQKIFELMERTDLTLQEVVRSADRYFDSAGTGRGTGYKQFQRWLYERKFHTDENGNYISPQTDWANYQASLPSLNSNNIVAAGNWTELGPWGWNRTSGWNPGTGRISAVAILPSNEQVIYVGSPGGGLWKTTNGGMNWQPLTDNNSTWMQIFAITIDPTNPNTIYVGTNGSGILKSTNAGATLAPAGGGPGGNVRKILIHPSNANIVFAACTNGIWRSTNAGTSWTQVHSGSKEDIEFKPADINIMYATGSDVYRSTNNGVNWTQVTAADGITNTGRTLVSVSASNPNYVYAAQANGSEFGRMYKSTDAGLTFTTTVVGSPTTNTNYFGYETSGAGTGGQATYDMAMDVSPTNPAEVYIAGIICWKSVNEGSSFSPITAWSLPNSVGYNHADVHGLFWVNATIYSISDGGIYKSINNGDDWIDLSTGLGIRQFYRMANSPTNATVITGGAQDNGSVTRQATTGNWADWLGADGMEGLVSPTNHLNLWGTSQNGSIYRSTNGGNSYSGLPKPSNGQWVTPLAIHPTNETIVFGGWTGVYKSTTSGTAWINISGSTITTTLADLAVAPSNPNYIYASNGATLYVTTDDGATWAIRSAPSTINDIAVDPTNPSKIWIACNSATNRILVSTDAGATFTNVSSNLPNIVARTIVVDDNTPSGMYVGMNIGVYYKTESDVNWTNYSDNLPLVAINELEIQKNSGKIRVATYGRGIWESPVANAAPPGSFIFNSPAATIATCPAPTTMAVTLSTIPSGGFTNPITLSVTAGVPVGTTISFGTNPVTPGNNIVVTLNNANTLLAGSYTITIIGNSTGATTQTRNITFTINPGTGPAISAQPANQAICAGANTSFNITAAGASTLQWQLSTDGGSTYTFLSNSTVYSGTTTGTLTITGAAASFNGNRYRCTAQTQCGSTNSNAGILTINSAPAITTAPQDATLCAGSNNTFTVAATGTAIGYQWQVSTDNGATYNNIGGATNSTYAVTGITTAMNGNRYRCVVSGACTPAANSSAAVLTVNSPATVTNQPANTEVCSGGNVTFTVAGSGTGLVYQWQVSTDGGSAWSNVAGGTSATLSLTGVTTAANANRYRCQVWNTTCTTPANSVAAILTVRQLPTVGLSASPLTSLFPGQKTILTATPSASTGGVLTTSWFKNGTAFSNTGNTYLVNIETTGSYQVRIQEAFSSGLVCSNQSAVVALDAAVSSNLFIFPSPNDGLFTVSYYNSDGSSTLRTVTVFDSKGSKVYNAKFTINGPYTLLSVNIKPVQTGIYYVVVGDAAGKKLAEGRVLVH